MICEVCQKQITDKILEKVFADREEAIKRMNQRSKNGNKKER
jgi:hypothetical protein|tara:strand:- start:27 stop:152 length:126 start_codon:yes stop_codon:yes gene_type:complete